MALVTMFRTARWMPSGSIRTSGRSARGLPGRASTPSSSARDCISSTTSADRLVQVGRLQRGLAVLGEREHVHDQVVDLRLVLLDDRPAAADDRLVLLVQAHVDQVAAAADALEDVLDVVRERGDRLADGGEPLGLELGLVERRCSRSPGRPGGRWRPSASGGPARTGPAAPSLPGPSAARARWRRGCRRRGRRGWRAAPGSGRRSPRGCRSRRSTARGRTACRPGRRR